MSGDGVYKHKDSKNWQIAFQVRKRRVSATSQTTSREEAVEMAKDLKERTRAAIAAENISGPEVTFDQAAYRYWKNTVDPRPDEELTKEELYRKTEKWDSLRDACALVGGNTPCSSVDTNRMVDIKQELQVRPAQTATKRLQNSAVNRKLSLIFAVLNVARDYMGCPLPKRPLMKKVRLQENERDLTISYEDESRVCGHLPDDYHAPFAFELETGLRRGDIVNLRWSDVSFEASTVKGHRKSAVVKSYPVPLNRRALAILEDMKRLTGGRPDDFVFTRLESRIEEVDGVPTAVTARVKIGSGAHFGRVMKKAFIAAGLLKHYFHDLRRTAGTRYYLATRDYEATRIFLGHSTINVTKRYIKIAVVNVALGVELMDEARRGRGWHIASRPDGAAASQRAAA